MSVCTKTTRPRQANRRKTDLENIAHAMIMITSSQHDHSGLTKNKVTKAIKIQC